MIYRLFADGVLIFHFCFVLFAAFGGLLVLYNRRVALIHLPAVVWSFLVQWFQWICPLTPLEIWLRQSSGEAGFQGGFIENYLSAILYLNLGRWLHIFLALAVIGLNFAVYYFVFKRLARTPAGNMK